MAVQRYNKYQYETSPRKLKPEYEPKREKRQPPKKTTKPQTSKKVVKQKKKGNNAKLVFYIILGFTILFAIGYQNALINENFTKKKDLQNSLASLKKENEQLQVSIENSLNLNNIEQSAKELLGMQKLDNSQKIYVSLPKNDYVEPATEEVVIEEELNIFQKIIRYITGENE